MSTRPFNIRIFVAEGIPDGLRMVEKSNWVGLGLICPRGRYPDVRKRDEFANSGVYILLGNEGDRDQPTVYVGEAETVRDRLDNHQANKDFWQTAIVFTTKGDPLNKAEVQYLEARLVELAKKNRRCHLDNSTQPKRPSLSEADEAEVCGYLAELLSLLPVLGVNVFEEFAAHTQSKVKFTLIGSDWNAAGHETNSGFLVLADSIARIDTVPSMRAHLKTRPKLIEDGILKESEGKLIFTPDYEFSSPSHAATVIAGRNTNGRDAWKDSRGKTLKEHQQNAVNL